MLHRWPPGSILICINQAPSPVCKYFQCPGYFLMDVASLVSEHDEVSPPGHRATVWRSTQYSQSHSCPLPLCLESKYICVTGPPVTQIRSRSQEVSSEPGARVGDEASEYADPPGDWWNVIWYDLMAKPESLMYRQYQRLLGRQCDSVTW